jgi:cytosine/creatinine deaminase
MSAVDEMSGMWPRITDLDASRAVLTTEVVMKDAHFAAAVEEARTGLGEGGLPIGSVLVLDGEIVGRGHNLRVQKGSPIFHAEIAALEDAGRLTHEEYNRATIYTTLSPCIMCSGAMLRAGIREVVVGENRTVVGAEDLLKANGVTVDVLDDDECAELMAQFIARDPATWAEDRA